MYLQRLKKNCDHLTKGFRSKQNIFDDSKLCISVCFPYFFVVFSHVACKGVQGKPSVALSVPPEGSQHSGGCGLTPLNT